MQKVVQSRELDASHHLAFIATNYGRLAQAYGL